MSTVEFINDEEADENKTTLLKCGESHMCVRVIARSLNIYDGAFLQRIETSFCFQTWTTAKRRFRERFLFVHYLHQARLIDSERGVGGEPKISESIFTFFTNAVIDLRPIVVEVNAAYCEDYFDHVARAVYSSSWMKPQPFSYVLEPEAPPAVASYLVDLDKNFGKNLMMLNALRKTILQQNRENDDKFFQKLNQHAPRFDEKDRKFVMEFIEYKTENEEKADDEKDEKLKKATKFRYFETVLANVHGMKNFKRLVFGAEKRCANCQASSYERFLFTCKRCAREHRRPKRRYCDKKCQGEHWKVHKKEHRKSDAK